MSNAFPIINTAAGFIVDNPVLFKGQFGIEWDTGKFKLGTGTTHYVDQSYAGGGGDGAVSSVFGRIGSVQAAQDDYTFAQLAEIPTTKAGYGIADVPSITGADAIAVVTTLPVTPDANTLYFVTGS